MCTVSCFPDTKYSLLHRVFVCDCGSISASKSGFSAENGHRGLYFASRWGTFLHTWLPWSSSGCLSPGGSCAAVAGFIWFRQELGKAHQDSPCVSQTNSLCVGLRAALRPHARPPRTPRALWPVAGLRAFPRCFWPHPGLWFPQSGLRAPGISGLRYHDGGQWYQPSLFWRLWTGGRRK